MLAELWMLDEVYGVDVRVYVDTGVEGWGRVQERWQAGEAKRDSDR